MTETTPTATNIELMWRPGCPFCSSLRRGLSRAGVVTTEHDIWSSAEAAARVRQATGGDETVPTVFVGDRALVNPSVRQVLEAFGAVDTDYLKGRASFWKDIKRRVALWTGSKIDTSGSGSD